MVKTQSRYQAICGLYIPPPYLVETTISFKTKAEFFERERERERIGIKQPLPLSRWTSDIGIVSDGGFYAGGGDSGAL